MADPNKEEGLSKFYPPQDSWAGPPDFFERIHRMNTIFEVGNPLELTDLGRHRVAQFYKIIADEIEEGLDILNMIDDRTRMTALADWLGDIIVYATSEMVRWGIPPKEILSAIMDSQDSKLVNGKPIKDHNNKFLKGPNYKPPEEDIEKILYGEDNGKKESQEENNL